MMSAERFVIETVFEDYGNVRVFEIIDRVSGRCLRRSQTKSVLESQVRRLNFEHDEQQRSPLYQDCSDCGGLGNVYKSDRECPYCHGMGRQKKVKM